jgi:hypothetical protein
LPGVAADLKPASQKEGPFFHSQEAQRFFVGYGVAFETPAVILHFENQFIRGFF